MVNPEKMIIDNRYAIVKRIGSGGFATVYKAWATNLEKFVAIKKIHEEYSQDAKFLDMFRDEAVNVAKLEHENIVRIIDFLRTTENIYYIIMEYVKGADLRKVLEKAKKLERKLPFEITAHIISAILKAIDYAYFKVDEITGKPLQVVHRDISPGNIMIYFDGRVKLTDFGIAKAASGPGEKTGLLRGKIAYMSPEQAEGNVKIDNRSDVFSMGVVFYELLTAQRLFEGDSEYNTWQRVKKGRVDLRPLRPLHKVNVPSVPEELVDILLRALEKDRRRRYQTAREMYVDLQRYLNRRKYGNYQEDVERIINELMKEEMEKEETESREEKEITLPEILEKSSAAGIFTPTPIPITLTPTTPPPQTPTPKPLSPIPVSAPITSATAKTPAQELIAADNPIARLPEVAPLAAPPEEKEEKEKTVFDFVLDTAKKYRRIFITTSLSLLFAGIGFQALDIFNQWTVWGGKIHNYFWPPALLLNSVPTGAKISLHSEEKNNALTTPGATTPIKIDKILPGNYLLVLEKSGYNKIERSITVLPNKKIAVSGTTYNHPTQADNDEIKAQNSFVIPFEADLEIDSYPPGATVYIDGKKIPGLTPLKQSLEVGVHTVKLILTGFEPLGNIEKIDTYGQCNLDLAQGVDKQKGIDHRYWEISKNLLNESENIRLLGKFWKKISVKTKPVGADIYIDNELQSRGNSPQTALELSAGKHSLHLVKAGFQTEERGVEVTADNDSKLMVVLKKWISLKAYGKNETENDIKAKVTIKGSEFVLNKVTPCKVALPINTYYLTFSKEPQYEPKRVRVNIGNVTMVGETLDLKNPIIKVYVWKDSEKKEPVVAANVLVNEKSIGTTNEEGYLEKSVAAGKSQIKVNTGGKYSEKIIEKELNTGQVETIEFALTTPDDATIVIDTRPKYFGAQIFVDGRLTGETIRKVENLTRQIHSVKIKHPELKKDLDFEVEFNQPNQTTILKINEQDQLFIEEPKKNE